MGVPTVTATSPINNAVNVDTRAIISVTFSEAVLKSTVTEGTIVLTDTTTAETIQGTFTFETSDTVVKFLPDQELRSNAPYSLVILGADLALPAGNIKSAATSDNLATSSTINFRVETERFVSLEEITDRSDIDHVAPIREESEIADVSGVIALLSTTPTGFSSNNPSIDTITATFDEVLDITAFNTSTMFSMEMNPILDLEMYLGNFNDAATPARKLHMEDTSVPVAIPSGTVSVSSNVLTWARDTGIPTGGHPYYNTFPFNAEVIVTLDSTLVGTSGDTLNEDVKFAFTTELYPMFSGSRTLRLDVGPTLDDFFDDTLDRLILHRSINGWMITAKRFSLGTPIQDVIEFTRWGSIIDVLEIVSVKSDLARGTSKQLGDFRVDFSNRAFAKPTGRIETAQKRLEAAEYRLRQSVASLRVKTVNIGSTASMGQLVFRGVRNWDSVVHYRRSDVPFTNTRRDRYVSQLIDQGARGSLNPVAFFSPRSSNDGYLYLFTNFRTI